MNYETAPRDINRGIQLTFKEGGRYEIFEKYFRPPKSLSLCISLLRNFGKNIPAPYKFHSPPSKNKQLCPQIACNENTIF